MSNSLVTAICGIIVGLALIHASPSTELFATEQASPDRYALGQRLRAFERAWDAQHDPGARKRAVAVLKGVVPLFFAGRLAEVSTSIDQSRFLLRSADAPVPEGRWAESLVVRPATRLLDPANGPLNVVLTTGYDAKVQPLPGAILRLSVRTADGKDLSVTAETSAKLPAVSTLAVNKLPAGDHLLRADIIVGDKVLASYSQMISVVPKLQERLERLQTAALAINTTRTTDTATLRSLTNLLSALADKQSQETDYPAARLVNEAEELARSIVAKDRFYGPQRPGEFWMTMLAGASTAPVRLFVPEVVKTGRPVPVVFALHGAGGSENLFFDGYGDGVSVRLARERGWIIVATRAEGLFNALPPVPAILDELAQLYPVDRKRVYLVGHSMGATHVVTLAQQAPGQFAAIAALGGGGSVTKPDALKGLPVYVGCGSEDFALGTAKALSQAVEKAGAKVTYREFPDVEHIVIVQESLPDVFNFFAKKN